VETKVCTKCGVEKPRTDFGTRKGGKPRSECKVCACQRTKDYAERHREEVRAKHREYNRRNREKLQETDKLWRSANREHLRARSRLRQQMEKELKNSGALREHDGPATRTCKICGMSGPKEDFVLHGLWRRNICKPCKNAQQRQYIAKHREHLNQRRKERYEANLEKSRLRQREVYQRNRERIREQNRGYYLQNREQIIARVKAWRHKNPSKLRDQIVRRQVRKLNAPVVEIIDRDAIIERDKSTCYLCGRVLMKSEVRLDHVIPLSRGGPHTADNLRVACNSCNCKKATKLLSELV